MPPSLRQTVALPLLIHQFVSSNFYLFLFAILLFSNAHLVGFLFFFLFLNLFIALNCGFYCLNFYVLIHQFVSSIFILFIFLYLQSCNLEMHIVFFFLFLLLNLFITLNCGFCCLNFLCSYQLYICANWWLFMVFFFSFKKGSY